MRRPSFIVQRARLDKKVTFQRMGEGKNEFNEPDETWADLFETRCAVYPAPGFERYANAQNAATAPIMCEVRSESRTKVLLPSDRMIVHGEDGLKESGQVYNLVAPIEQLDRGTNIRIIAAADK